MNTFWRKYSRRIQKFSTGCRWTRMVSLCPNIECRNLSLGLRHLMNLVLAHVGELMECEVNLFFVNIWLCSCVSCVFQLCVGVRPVKTSQLFYMQDGHWSKRTLKLFLMTTKSMLASQVSLFEHFVGPCFLLFVSLPYLFYNHISVLTVMQIAEIYGFVVRICCVIL